MTQEQAHSLQTQIIALHPDRFKKSQVFYDEEYERDEQEAIEEAEGILWEDVEVVEDCPFQPGSVILTDAAVDEWEEVE